MVHCIGLGHLGLSSPLPLVLSSLFFLRGYRGKCSGRVQASPAMTAPYLGPLPQRINAIWASWAPFVDGDSATAHPNEDTETSPLWSQIILNSQPLSLLPRPLPRFLPPSQHFSCDQGSETETCLCCCSYKTEQREGLVAFEGVLDA